MSKNTEFDIRPCTRQCPSSRPLTYDMTQNRHFADIAIQVADRFFKFDFSQVYFSGFVREDDGQDSSLSVEIWNESSLCYDVSFEDIGVSGTIYADLKGERDLETALGQDVIGAICRAVNEVRQVDPGFRRLPEVSVEDNHLQFCLDMRP